MIISDGFGRWIAFGIISDGFVRWLCSGRLIFEWLCWVDFVWDYLRWIAFGIIYDGSGLGLFTMVCVWDYF
jgi:hypothetical protein